MFLLVPAYPGRPGQKAVKRLCVCVYYSIQLKKPRRYEKGCYSDMRSKAYMSQINLQHGTTNSGKEED